MFMVDSLKIREKFCVNCKFVKERNNIDKEYSQCTLFPLNDNYLVTGNKNTSKFYYCTTARGYDTMCGKNATKYKKLKNKTSSLLD
jgi:hypothetical protein